MADKTLKATLIADDKMSSVFKKAGDSAKTLGESLEHAGDAGTSAAQGLDDFGQSAQRSEEETRKLTGAAKDIGLGLGVLIGGLALSGKAFRDQEIAIDSLRRSYGDASDDMVEFANHLQDSTNYSNDAALDAANTAATLARNYGFSAQEIQQVLQISADLAATTGFSLEDATQRVTAALRGEAEGAEVLGLTMNQAAIDSQNLTLSMSNQEAGHYRLNALIQQSAFAQGAAAEQADTTYGSMVQLGHGFQDAAQSVGSFLGPFGEIGAYLSDNALKVGALSLSLGQLGKAAIGVNTLTTSLTGVSASSAIAGSGIAGLAGAAGIAGLGIAATIAVTGGVGMLIGKLAVDTPKAAGDASKSIQELIDKALELDNIGAIGSDLIDIADASEYNDAIIELTSHVNDLLDLGYTLEREGSKPIGDALFAGFSDTAKDVLDANNDMVISFEEVNAAVDALTYDNHAMAASAAAMNTAFAASADEIDIIMHATGEGAQRAKEALDNLIDGVLNGTLDPTELEGALQGVIKTLHDTQKASLDANGAMADNTNGWTAHSAAVDAATKAMQDYLDLEQQIAGQAVADSFDVGFWDQQETDAALAAMQDYLDLEQQIAGQAVATGRIIKDFGNDLAFTGGKKFGGEFKYDFDFGEALEGMSLAEAAMQQFGERIIQAYDAIATAPEALANGFRVIVSNTDAIGDNAQQVQDWADELIGAAGEYAKIDDLLADGTITLDQYNAAQQAQVDITRENAEIQQDIQTIQAKQAPVLAELMAATENYLQTVADMDGIQQTAALGFMDSAESAQALQLKMLALDAASGALGANGAEWATGIIEGAAAADPVLAAMLEQMGLISIGADGTITVNLDDQASGPLQQLNDSVEKLAFTQILLAVGIENEDDARRIFEELFGHAADWDDTEADATLGADNSDALERIGEAQNALGEWSRTTGTGTVDADNSGAMATLGDAANALGDWDRSNGSATLDVTDNATDTLSTALALAHQFANSSATATFTAYYNSVGSAGDHSLFARHGGIPGYAHGGIPVELAEAGPELLHFANGGVLPIYDRGIYPIPEHTYVSPNNTGTATRGGVTIHVDLSGAVINGYDDFVDRVTDDLSRAWQRANTMYERGMGW